MFEFFSKNQQKLAIVAGYALVFMLAFGLGRITVLRPVPPEIRIEEPSGNSRVNSNAEVQGAQSQSVPPGGQKLYPSGFAPTAGSCSGLIKGSSSHIYHLPGGAFYSRTTKPAWCFNTEAEAQAAGFRKSAR